MVLLRVDVFLWTQRPFPSGAPFPLQHWSAINQDSPPPPGVFLP